MYVNTVNPGATDGSYHGEYGTVPVATGAYTNYKLFKVVATYTATQDQIDAFQSAATKTITFTATLDNTSSAAAKMFEANVNNGDLAALPSTTGDVEITINMASITAANGGTVEGNKYIGVYIDGADVSTNGNQTAKIVKKTA